MTSKEKTLFVMVGTTQFQELIQTVSHPDTLKVIEQLGFRHVKLQIGQGEEPELESNNTSVNVEFFRRKPSVAKDIEDADLVISHAGAGCVLETLGAGKPLLVIINERLMGNHQIELAHQLGEDGHLYYGTCDTLRQMLQESDFSKLKPFPPPDPQTFGTYLDKVVGFS